MTTGGTIRCRCCGRPIVGCATTKYGGGWVHERTNAERCPPPHRSFAAPPSLEDLNAKVLADGAKQRARKKARTGGPTPPRSQTEPPPARRDLFA